MKISDLIGKPVVSMADGEKVGVVKDLVIDPEKLHATAFLLGGAPGQGFLPLEAVKSVGADAITIESAHLIKWATGQLSTATGREACDLKNLTVVDGSGTALGKLLEIYIDLPSGRIVSLHVSGGGVFGIGGHSTDIPAANVRTIGASLITAEPPPAEPV